MNIWVNIGDRTRQTERFSEKEKFWPLQDGLDDTGAARLAVAQCQKGKIKQRFQQHLTDKSATFVF